MNASRAAAAHRKLAEAHLELAEALEDGDAPPAKASVKRRRRSPGKLIVPDDFEPSELDKKRAEKALRKAGLVGSGS